MNWVIVVNDPVTGELPGQHVQKVRPFLHHHGPGFDVLRPAKPTLPPISPPGAAPPLHRRSRSLPATAPPPLLPDHRNLSQPVAPAEPPPHPPSPARSSRDTALTIRSCWSASLARNSRASSLACSRRSFSSKYLVRYSSAGSFVDGVWLVSDLRGSPLPVRSQTGQIRKSLQILRDHLRQVFDPCATQKTCRGLHSGPFPEQRACIFADFWQILFFTIFSIISNCSVHFMVFFALCSEICLTDF